MRNETGHESHVLNFLNAALTFMMFSLSLSIRQEPRKPRSWWCFFTGNGSEKLYCSTSTRERSSSKNWIFLNKSQWIICQTCIWTARVSQCLHSPAHLTLILHTCHVSLPVMHRHVCMCARHIVSSEIQLSKGQVSSRAHCAVHCCKMPTSLRLAKKPKRREISWHPLYPELISFSWKSKKSPTEILDWGGKIGEITHNKHYFCLNADSAFTLLSSLQQSNHFHILFTV